jgi:predicted RNase H-like HicB family nuclease
MVKKLEDSRKQAAKELLKEAKANKLPCQRIHGYDVYFDGNNQEGWGSFCPTLLGCVSAGDTITECKRNMAEAIEFHLDGMRKDGDPIPPRDGRATPRPTHRKGRTTTIPSRVSPETAKILAKISKARGISKTEALELAIATYGKRVKVKA